MVKGKGLQGLQGLQGSVGQILSEKWLIKKKFLMQIIPEAKDLGIYLMMCLPARIAFNGDEDKVKARGFSMDDDVYVYGIDVLYKYKCKKKLLQRIKSLIGGEGHYAWSKNGYLKARIVVERTSK